VIRDEPLFRQQRPAGLQSGNIPSQDGFTRGMEMRQVFRDVSPRQVRLARGIRGVPQQQPTVDQVHCQAHQVNRKVVHQLARLVFQRIGGAQEQPIGLYQLAVQLSQFSGGRSRRPALQQRVKGLP
jgi:hypothetical protein